MSVNVKKEVSDEVETPEPENPGGRRGPLGNPCGKFELPLGFWAMLRMKNCPKLQTADFSDRQRKGEEIQIANNIAHNHYRTSGNGYNETQKSNACNRDSFHDAIQSYVDANKLTAQELKEEKDWRDMP
ncbi:MAG: hypothetical protein MR508_07315 [Lachnospiraceae bacterium]|nr:hypothetical protein [Lachnospiraceae bacterium]